MRDVQPVLAAERQMEVVARDPGHLLRLEAEQLADAVVLVHHVVADTQIGEARERPAEPPVRARGSLAEDLRVREQDETQLAPDEPAARRRDRETQRRVGGERLPVREHRRLDLPQERRLPLGLAAMRERHDDAVPRADESGELVLRLGEAARRDGRPLRLERVRLRLRERVELGRAVEGNPRKALLLGDATDVVRLPDEIWRALDRRDEILRDLDDRLAVALLRPEVDVEQIGAALDCRMDDRVVGRVQRTLRERREGAHLLDLVAEELDPERLPAGGREHVDDPTAHGELASLVDPLDALVPGEREPVGKPVDPGLVPDPEHERARPRCPRRQPLRERCDRRTDEPSGLEDVERAVALTDQVRRRDQSRLVRDAPARKEGDPRGVPEPRGAVGSVPRVGVLGEQHEERAAELGVERREHERQHRLRDAGPRRERVDERLEALGAPKLLHEGGERRDGGRAGGGLVHAAGGDRAPRGHRTGPLANHPQGHPRALLSRYRRTCAWSAPASCRMCATFAKPAHTPLEGSRDPNSAQLKRRCVSSRPSAASASTASQARATIASASSSGAKAERT